MKTALNCKVKNDELLAIFIIYRSDDHYIAGGAAFAASLIAIMQWASMECWL